MVREAKAMSEADLPRVAVVWHLFCAVDVSPKLTSRSNTYTAERLMMMEIVTDRSQPYKYTTSSIELHQRHASQLPRIHSMGSTLDCQ